jgi:hypothetical protein
MTDFSFRRSGALFGVFDDERGAALFQKRPKPGCCLYMSSLGMT